MKKEEINKLFAMPVEGASYPKGPYRFQNREFLIVKFETDPEAIKAVIPEPLEVYQPLASFEVIHMPDSSGFGSYTESGITLPVKYKDGDGAFVANMFLNDHPPIAAGREIWGFPKKWGEPSLRVVRDQVVGTLDYSGVRVATATMAYKYEAADRNDMTKSIGSWNYNLKIIPSVDGTAAIIRLIRYRMTDINVKWAWKGPASLDLRPSALAPIYKFPVLNVIEGYHVLTDLTLPYGEVVYDYLKG